MFAYASFRNIRLVRKTLRIETLKILKNIKMLIT